MGSWGVMEVMAVLMMSRGIFPTTIYLSKG